MAEETVTLKDLERAISQIVNSLDKLIMRAGTELQLQQLQSARNELRTQLTRIRAAIVKGEQ